MKVTIWDLDYYYAKEKVNCFNPDVMKISSYHKQMGDTINFVTSQDDIRRPYDEYYIIKENNKTPNPPLDFFTNRKIKWWGNAFRIRVNWKMNAAMMGCRPDYLLYPEYNTQLERAEHVRFFDNNGKLLEITQNYSNSFKKKKVILTDKYMWISDKNSILKVLDRIKDTKNIYFLNEIWLKKIIYDEEIKNKFLTLTLSPGANLTWTKVKQEDVVAALDFLSELKNANPSVNIGELRIDYSDKGVEHWDNRDAAIKDLNQIKNFIVRGKKQKIKVVVEMPRETLETPYYHFFSFISDWTIKTDMRSSWLEYITRRFSNSVGEDAVFYWNNPHKWHELFRDLLRQTYNDKDFLLWKWGDKKYNEYNVPFSLWQEEFKNGI